MKNNKLKSTSVLLPPGEYLIIDPCYVYDKDHWHKLCNRLHKMQDIISDSAFGMQDEDGNPFLIIPTKHGDGSYDLIKDNNTIFSLGVDSGLLSVIPHFTAMQWEDYDNGIELGKVIKIEEESLFRAEDGDFSLGDFSVNTSQEDTYEDEEDWSGDEEQEIEAENKQD